MAKRREQQHTQSHLEDLLLAFRREVVGACKREGMKYELTFSQVEIVRFIGERDKTTMKEIAEYLKITPPSATVLVAEMERKGLIERQGDRKDRRVVFITFTGKAKKLFEKLSKRKQTILHAMLSKLSVSDQRSLERIIRILISK